MSLPVAAASSAKIAESAMAVGDAASRLAANIAGTVDRFAEGTAIVRVVAADGTADAAHGPGGIAGTVQTDPPSLVCCAAS